jgi:putative oxidoreductase
MDIKFLALWVCIIAVTLPCIAFAIKKLRLDPEKVQQFEKWGYSKSFMLLITVIELMACVALFFPMSRFYGVCVWAVILVGAFFTHLRVKDEIGATVTPVFVGVLVWLVYYLG